MEGRYVHQVVALELCPAFLSLSVNIAGLVGEVTGGADPKDPLPASSCGHCVQGLASALDTQFLFP